MMDAAQKTKLVVLCLLLIAFSIAGAVLTNIAEIGLSISHIGHRERYCYDRRCNIYEAGTDPERKVERCMKNCVGMAYVDGVPEDSSDAQALKPA